MCVGRLVGATADSGGLPFCGPRGGFDEHRGASGTDVFEEAFCRVADVSKICEVSAALLVAEECIYGGKLRSFNDIFYNHLT